MLKTRARWAIICVIFAAILLAGAARLTTPRIYAAASRSLQQTTQRKVVITVDDLPGAEPGTDHAASNIEYLQKINHDIPAILRSHHVPAIGFVNEWKLQVPGQRDARAALLQSWLDDGLTLGNHTYSHPDFSKTPLAEYEDETIRGEVVTSALMAAKGEKEKYFRHPFLATGPNAVDKAEFEAFLERRGYRVAPVTIDPSDYAFNDVFGEALERNDSELVAKVKREYLDYMDKVFAFEEEDSRKLFGREIPQILLIHDSNLNAECLDAVLARIANRGYTFISLDDALADPAYGTPDLYVGPLGISWLTRWRLSFHLPLNYETDPDPPKWVMDEFDAFRKAHAKH